MSRIIIYPYDMKSESYGLLRDTLREAHGKENVIGVYSDGAYSPKKSDVIVGWGYSKSPLWGDKALTVGANWLNRPSSIGNAVHKDTAFFLFRAHKVGIPNFTSSAKEASVWVSQEIPVVQREILTGSKGKGASVAHIPQEFNPHAKLYTQLVPKKREFRVHVFQGKVIDVHEKIFKGKNAKDFEIMAAQTPEQDESWVWKRSGVVLPLDAATQSERAVSALGLAFGGVDVVIDKAEKAYVLEVNTAPWLGTKNVQYYVKSILKEVA